MSEEREQVATVEVEETPEKKKSHKGLIGLAIAAVAIGAAVVVKKVRKKDQDDEFLDDDFYEEDPDDDQPEVNPVVEDSPEKKAE